MHLPVLLLAACATALQIPRRPFQRRCAQCTPARPLHLGQRATPRDVARHAWGGGGRGGGRSAAEGDGSTPPSAPSRRSSSPQPGARGRRSRPTGSARPPRAAPSPSGLAFQGSRYRRKSGEDPAAGDGAPTAAAKIKAEAACRRGLGRGLGRGLRRFMAARCDGTCNVEDTMHTTRSVHTYYE